MTSDNEVAPQASQSAWYFEKEGQRVGPFRTQDVPQLIRAGVIMPGTTLLDQSGNRASAERIVASVVISNEQSAATQQCPPTPSVTGGEEAEADTRDEMHWWLSQDGRKTGPHSEAEILNKLRSGLLTPDTLAARGTRLPTSDWQRLEHWLPFVSACGGPEQGLQTSPTCMGEVGYGTFLEQVSGETPRQPQVYAGTAHQAGVSCPDPTHREKLPESQARPGLGASTPTPTGPSSTSGVGVMVVGGLGGFGLLLLWLGWTTFITIVLWLLVGIAALAAIGFACAAFGKSEENERNGLWIAAGGCAAISFLAWVFIPAGSQSNSLTPNQLKGQQTLAYWNGLPSALQSVGQNQPRNMQEEVILLNSIAARIDRLPTSGVDADAIQCGLALRNWLRAVADDKARANSPQFAIQTFARGFQGDVLGPIVEYAQNSAALEQQHAAVGDQFAATRARLSSRYDIEFPPVLR